MDRATGMSTLDRIVETVERVMDGELSARIDVTGTEAGERTAIEQINDVLATLEKTRSNKRVYVEGLRETLAAHESAVSCLSAACRMSESVNCTTNVESLCRLLARIVVEEFDVENCSIFLLEPHKEFLRLTAAYGQQDRWGGNGKKRYNTNLRIPVGKGIAGRVCHTKKYMFVSDVSENSDFKAINSEVPIGTLLCIPLLYQDQVLGVLNLSHPYTNHILQTQKLELMFLSKIIGNLLSLCRAQGMLREFNKELEKRVIAQTAKLEESEKRYRCLVENAADIVFTLDRDGLITFVNSRARDLLGQEPSLLLGCPFHSLLGGDLKEEEATKISRWLAAERVDGEELCLRQENGSTITLSASIHTMFERGDVLGKQGVLRDVTRQRKLEEQLARSEKLKALGELAGGVAHNFNNILGGILGKAELALFRTTDSRIQQYIETIRKAALDGAETVKRIQEFTRVRTDTSHFRQVDINEIVMDAIDFTRTKWKDEAEARGTEYHLTTKLGSLRRIAGHASELREVFTNIILNALDAMPDGGTLHIGTSMTFDSILISFADTGVGIPEEIQQRIFDPFFSTKGPAGQGLGLSVSYGIISRHGGTITVESSPEKGSTFKILLPLLEGVPADGATPDDPLNPRTSLSVLVIDDEAMIRETMNDMLSLLGHEPTTAADGPEALALSEQRRFDVIFTDLGMPCMNGWQVADELARRRPGTPVIMMTGWGVQIDTDQEKAKNIQNILPKPFNLDQVKTILREAVGIAAQPA